MYRDKNIHHIWLYILKLTEDKYYVGITSLDDPFKRIKEHIDSKGAKWTKHYSALSVIEIHDLGFMYWDEAIHEEQLTTQDYMDVFDVNNVRGGFVNKDGSVLYFWNRFFFDSLYKLVFGTIITAIGLFIIVKSI